MNDAAEFARGQVKRELPQHFKIRSNWVPGAIRVERGTMYNQQAIVGVSDKSSFMVAHELGGDKKRKGSEQALPVDVRGSGGMGKTLRGSNWPKDLLKKSEDVYVVRTATRIGVVIKRQGRGKKQGKVLYTLIGKTLHIKKRWNFRQRVEEIGRDVMPPLFATHLTEAMRTAK